MKLLRDVWALLRDLPDAVARWCDRTVMAAHRPEMVPADDLTAWPDGERPWCMRCMVAWPCEAYAEAWGRLTDSPRLPTNG